MNFFENPVLNSPYSPPRNHWRLDADGHPTDDVRTARRSSAVWTALPGAAAKSARTQTSMVFDGDRLSTEATEFNPSPIINDLRQEVATWRALRNPAQWKVTPTTQRLLQHWRAVQADETQNIRPIFCQLEAVEAAIWLAEVAPQMGKRGKRFASWLRAANNLGNL